MLTLCWFLIQVSVVHSQGAVCDSMQWTRQHFRQIQSILQSALDYNFNTILIALWSTLLKSLPMQYLLYLHRSWSKTNLHQSRSIMRFWIPLPEIRNMVSYFWKSRYSLKKWYSKHISNKLHLSRWSKTSTTCNVNWDSTGIYAFVNMCHTICCLWEK